MFEVMTLLYTHILCKLFKKNIRNFHHNCQKLSCTDSQSVYRHRFYSANNIKKR